MLLHELGQDLVLALELGLQLGELAVLVAGVGLAALVAVGEGGMAVLEEDLLPRVEEADGDVVFLADVGDRDFIDEVLSEQGDLLLGSEVAALPGHGCSSARVLPPTPAKANSSSD